MKSLTSLVTASLLALGISGAALADGAKGGKLTTLFAPKIVESKAVSNAAMSCPTAVRTTLDSTGRGRFERRAYTAHDCSSCKTREVVKGAGKLAVRTIEHSCEKATVCCK